MQVKDGRTEAMWQARGKAANSGNTAVSNHDKSGSECECVHDGWLFGEWSGEVVVEWNVVDCHVMGWME